MKIDETNPEEATLKSKEEQYLIDLYGKEEELKYAQSFIQKINDDLELREKPSAVFNGIAYSQGYEYNQKKAINYAPPRNATDDREVSLGLVHEKIVSFIAIFLKYVFKRRIKCYDDKGQLIKGLGDIYDLAIEHSYKVEQFKNKIALIYWEVFTQGNAFVLEDWEVKMDKIPKAFVTKDGERVEVISDNMDYTYEFLDGLEYEKGEEIQRRRAVSRVLDGRNVIFGNPEIEEIQEQPRITIEEQISYASAKALFGTLKRWNKIPKSTTEIDVMVGEKTTLFDAKRHKSPKDTYIIHRVMDRENNRFNIFVNGVMMLPMLTPMTLFYPRGFYNITNVPAERLRGSIYARSIPAKTKFNADFVDWALKMLAQKFEQGIDPAILTKSRYTLTRQMFRGGQVTHGVSTDEFEKADPDNKGITQSEFSFMELLKQILEAQTTNPTTSGELASNATATEISITENNQRDKLGGLLDSLVGGFMDMALRRAETIESKYTIKQKETLVDGKKVSVYQDFTINVAGIEHVVSFQEEVGTPAQDQIKARNDLFKKSFDARKAGYPTEYYLANPEYLRKHNHSIDIDVQPEKIKDTQLQLIQMWDDFTQRLNIFGQDASIDAMKKEYLETSGKPDDTFTTQMYAELDQNPSKEGDSTEAYNKGSFGKPQQPKVKDANQRSMGVGGKR